MCCKDLIIRFNKDDFLKLEPRFPNANKSITYQNEFEVVFAHGCPFLIDNKCGIYEKRPIPCKMYPVSIKDDYFIITCACPAFDTLTRKDIAEAKRYYSFFKGEKIKEKNRFISLNSEDAFYKMNDKFIHFVNETDNDEFDVSLEIKVDEYLDKLRDKTTFDKWVKELKAKQNKLNYLQRKRKEIKKVISSNQ